ncbi:type VII secretion target [Mycolicibacterium sp. CBM1]
MGSTRVDTAAVRAVAQRFAAAADILDGVSRTHLSRLRFDGSAAGRAHTASGGAVRAALDHCAAELAQWSRAAEEIAAALRSVADHYTEAELKAALR